MNKQPDMDNRFCNETAHDEEITEEKMRQLNIKNERCAFRGNFETTNVAMCTHKDPCNFNCFEEYFRFENKEIKPEEEEDMFDLDNSGDLSDEERALRAAHEAGGWANVSTR
jgi:hypothetical protein